MKLTFTTKLGLLIIFGFFFIGLLAPWLSPYDPKGTEISSRFSPPSPTHWLGQDKLGGDIYSKLIYGAKISLTVAVTATVISLLIGLILGSAAGYFGGLLDECLM